LVVDVVFPSSWFLFFGARMSRVTSNKRDSMRGNNKELALFGAKTTETNKNKFMKKS
jgi:hypothetical protein